MQIADGISAYFFLVNYFFVSISVLFHLFRFPNDTYLILSTLMFVPLLIKTKQTTHIQQKVTFYSCAACCSLCPMEAGGLEREDDGVSCRAHGYEKPGALHRNVSSFCSFCFSAAFMWHLIFYSVVYCLKWKCSHGNPPNRFLTYP